MRKKKAMANGQVDENPLREAASFKVSVPYQGSMFVLPPYKKRVEDDSTALTDSCFVSGSEMSTRLPRLSKENIVGFERMRYITGGSSTNVTDSNIGGVLPFNPPPTIASSGDAVSLTSLNEFSRVVDDDEDDDVISEMTLDYMPAPPATPLYCPSDVESSSSCMLTEMDSVSQVGKQRSPDRRCTPNHSHNHTHHLQKLYKRHANNRTNSQPCRCEDESSNYSNSLDRRRVPHSNCSYSTSSSQDAYQPLGHHQKAPSSYHPPSLVSEESSYSSRTLPKHLHHGPSRQLLPSLASGLSRCSSEASIITVRHKADLMPSYGNDSSETSSNYYNSYGPPPSPGVNDFPPDMNNFEDFKDEEEEALENDLLLESQRSLRGTVD